MVSLTLSPHQVSQGMIFFSVFGFSTKELVMPESGQAYTVNVGVLSGSFDEKIELDVLLHLGTARK